MSDEKSIPTENEKIAPVDIAYGKQCFVIGGESENFESIGLPGELSKSKKVFFLIRRVFRRQCPTVKSSLFT